MASYFPIPLPDELFFSILSRYYSHTLSSVIQVSRSLFGTDTFSSNFHIPNKIKTVVSRIATVSSMDVDTFIKNHTLYPFLASFGDKKRSERMYEFMALGGERFVLNRISGLELGVHKYCPICAIEDRSNYGETYWHRIHNLPSVISCTKHKCLLKSYLAKQNKNQSYFLVTAESVIVTAGYIEPAGDLEVRLGTFHNTLNKILPILEIPNLLNAWKGLQNLDRPFSYQGMILCDVDFDF